MAPDTPQTRNFFEIPKNELPAEVWAYPQIHAQLMREIREKKLPKAVQIDFILNCVRYAFRQKLAMERPYLAVMLRQLRLADALPEDDRKLKERLEKDELIKQLADQLSTGESVAIPAPVVVTQEVQQTEAKRKPKSEEDYLKSMKNALQGHGEYVEPTYSTAVMHAIQALQAYPDNPTVLLSAAICYQARGYKLADLPVEQRMQDLEHAIELITRFLGLTGKDTNEKTVQQRKSAGARQYEIRKKLDQMKEKEAKKMPEK